jgi:sugar phosphate isomerase/epimerase
MKHGIHRRDFLRRASLLSLASAAGLGGAGALARAELLPVKRTGGARFKLSLNAYSFDAALDTHKPRGKDAMDLMWLAGFCAEHNFDGLDATGYYFPGYYDRKVPDDGAIFALKRRAFDLGVAISGTGISNCFTTADKTARAKDADWVRQWIVVAAKLGAPVLRIYADSQSGAKTWEQLSGGAKRADVEAWIAEEIRGCAEEAARHGVVLGVQNHGDFLKTGDDVLSLLKRIDSPWCGAIVDTGSFKADDPYAEIAKVAPYAVSWQIKQSAFGTGKDAARTPADHLKKLFAIVRGCGYRGWLPIETLAPEGGGAYDPQTLVPKFLAEVRVTLAMTNDE